MRFKRTLDALSRLARFFSCSTTRAFRSLVETAVVVCCGSGFSKAPICACSCPCLAPVLLVWRRAPDPSSCWCDALFLEGKCPKAGKCSATAVCTSK